MQADRLISELVTQSYNLRSMDCGSESVPSLGSMNTTDYYYDCFQDDQACSSALSDGSSVVPVILYVLFGLGLLGNVTVLWVLIRYIKLKTMTDVCLLNLSLSDLTMAMSLPLWAYSYHNQLNGSIPCKVMTGVYQLGLYSGTLFVTLMSLDRYLAIVHAVAALRARTRRYGTAASIAVWVTAIAMAAPQVVFADMVLEEDDSGTSSLTCQQIYPIETEYSWKMLRNFSENTVVLFLCLPIMAFCYVNILVVLQRCRNSKKERAVKLILTIVCAFVVCWVPYSITIFLQTLQLFEILNNCTSSSMINSALGVAEIIALAHCCVNPIIYAFVGEKFRKSLRKVLSRYICWNHHLSVGVSSLRDTTEKETSNTPVRSEY